MKEVSEKAKRTNGNGDTWQLERQKLVAICDEKSSELEQFKREGQGLREQVDLMRREVSLTDYFSILVKYWLELEIKVIVLILV